MFAGGLFRKKKIGMEVSLPSTQPADIDIVSYQVYFLVSFTLLSVLSLLPYFKVLIKLLSITPPHPPSQTSSSQNPSHIYS
jgi:hypothetical protein